MEPHDIEVRGTTVHVRRWGERAGTPLFYWHGGGGTEAPILAPPLVEAGYTPYAVDAPGYGKSAPLDRGEYRLSILADLAAELLEVLGLTPVIWVGFSWGGNVGMHTAVRKPPSVRALALLDGGYLVAEDDPGFDPHATFEDEVEQLRRLRAETGETWDAPDEVVAAAMVASRAAPCPPLYPALRDSGIPILLAHATEPQELQGLRLKALARFRTGLPQARIAPIPNASHGILEDNGPEVIRVLLAWLDELG
ncbi:MAG TPA: alpha/beta fold hydrolase [Gaiellaceae bacterium]|jgi:pimeloyl-ACP methyl ester carboxylesterase